MSSTGRREAVEEILNREPLSKIMPALFERHRALKERTQNRRQLTYSEEERKRIEALSTVKH